MPLMSKGGVVGRVTRLGAIFQRQSSCGLDFALPVTPTS